MCERNKRKSERARQRVQYESERVCGARKKKRANERGAMHSQSDNRLFLDRRKMRWGKGKEIGRVRDGDVNVSKVK